MLTPLDWKIVSKLYNLCLKHINFEVKYIKIYVIFVLKVKNSKKKQKNSSMFHKVNNFLNLLSDKSYKETNIWSERKIFIDSTHFYLFKSKYQIHIGKLIHQVLKIIYLLFINYQFCPPLSTYRIIHSLWRKEKGPGTPQFDGFSLNTWQKEKSYLQH